MDVYVSYGLGRLVEWISFMDLILGVNDKIFFTESQ